MWFTRRAIVLHLIIAVVVPTFIGLWWWQWHAALAGNELSWAYTFEWPIFTGYAIFVWWKMVHQQPEPKTKPTRAQRRFEARPIGWALEKHPQPLGGGPVEVEAPGTQPTPAVATATGSPGLEPTAQRDERPGTDDEDPELAAYNEYLAALAASGKRKTW